MLPGETQNKIKNLVPNEGKSVLGLIISHKNPLDALHSECGFV
jgi:hypothetical protein